MIIGSQRGATAVEYALLSALIAMAIIVAVTLFGGNVRGLFDNANASIDSSIAP